MSKLFGVATATGPQIHVASAGLTVWTTWTAEDGTRISLDLEPGADYSTEDVTALRDGLTELINQLEGK